MSELARRGYEERNDLLSRLAYRFVRFALLLWCKLWFRITVDGRENVPTDGAYVICPGAHRSNLDTIVTSFITRRRIRYMGKDTLWKTSFSAWFFTTLGSFPVDREAADREALRTCEHVAHQGEPLVMFPEGTRGSGPEVGHMYQGPAFIACRARVPIIPVGIGGAERAMPQGRKWVRPTRMVVIIGQPIHPDVAAEGRVPRSKVTDLTERLRAELQKLFDEAQARVGA